MDSKWEDDQPQETPSWTSEEQTDEGLELLSHPRCLSAIPGEVQEWLEDDQESDRKDWKDQQ